ncbi:MAG: glycine cleavage system protein H, partial [Candidatus Zixiibacteriota bacterium]
IWMTAGVISFKLCPLDYDCEHCDFDEVMRSQVRSSRGKSRVRPDRSETPAPSEGIATGSVDSKKPLFFTFSAGEVGQDLYLYPTHLWVRRLEEDKWKVGIDNLLAYVLPTAAEVELNRPGTRMLQNQLLGKVHTQAGTIPLAAPLSGRLVHTNPLLGERPGMVQEDPYGEGWLAVMESSPEESDLKNYSVGASSRTFLEEEAQHLRFLLKHRGIELDNIGETLPDGGAHVKYLHQVLPDPVCLRLATELIMSGKQAW